MESNPKVKPEAAPLTDQEGDIFEKWFVAEMRLDNVGHEARGFLTRALDRTDTASEAVDYAFKRLWKY